MDSNSLNPIRGPLEPLRDVGPRRVAGLLQDAGAVLQGRGFEAATMGEKADGLFDNYGYSE